MLKVSSPVESVTPEVPFEEGALITAHFDNRPCPGVVLVPGALTSVVRIRKEGTHVTRVILNRELVCR